MFRHVGVKKLFLASNPFAQVLYSQGILLGIQIAQTRPLLEIMYLKLDEKIEVL